MIPRLLAPYLQRDATYYPVLTLTGPRQLGKTTLAQATLVYGGAERQVRDGIAVRPWFAV